MTDAELKSYLVENGFSDFKFNSNGTYSFSQRVIGGHVFGEGDYSIKNGVRNFETIRNNEYTPQYGNCFSELLELPGKYKIDFEATNIYHQGAMVNINNPSMIYWSDNVPKAYSKITHNGVECIRYPWFHDVEGQETECDYIVLLENLKLRKYPSTDAPLVSVGGIDEYCAYSYERRSVEFAGNYCVIRAKTVETSTIDGITAPWYLILAYGNDEMGMDVEEAWIFGGYVKEFKSSQVSEIKSQYRSLLERSILNAGGHLKSQD